MSIGRAAAVVDEALAACLLAVGSYGVARHDLLAGWPCVGFGFVFTGLALIWARTMRGSAASPGAAGAAALSSSAASSGAANFRASNFRTAGSGKEGAGTDGGGSKEAG